MAALPWEVDNVSWSTPIDFAYAVHTDVGNACVGCRINRRLAALSQPLSSGQTVEIITAKGSKPNPGWLDIVATSRARSQIRHFLKHLRRGESIAFGQRLLNKALKTHGSNYQQINDEQKQALVEALGAEDMDQLLEEIGLGDRVANLTAGQLLGLSSQDSQEGLSVAGRDHPLVISGSEGMATSSEMSRSTSVSP